MKYLFLAICIAFSLTSVIAIIITVYDKLAAKSRKRRIPEKTLLLTGFLGGAATMFLTMKIIRHKTQHMKFMILLPIFTILHITALVLIYFNIA